MGRNRTRIDDEEALIPRGHVQEFHATNRVKVQGRRSCWCSVKCWFGMFLLLILASTALFYFIYPSVVHENINKFIGFACGASGYTSRPNVTITCLVMTSQATIQTQAVAIDNTWARRCSNVYYFYRGRDDVSVTKLQNTYAVDDVASVQPLSIVLNTSDITSWYLVADDMTYVNHVRLQRHLATQQHTTPRYVGDDVTLPDGGAYVINSAAAKMFVTRKKSKKIRFLINSVLNVTESDLIPGFTALNPLTLTDPEQNVEITAKAYAFRDVTAEQMYSFYIIGGST